MREIGICHCLASGPPENKVLFGHNDISQYKPAL